LNEFKGQSKPNLSWLQETNLAKVSETFARLYALLEKSGFCGRPSVLVVQQKPGFF
jgi:hypothetical protein